MEELVELNNSEARATKNSSTISNTNKRIDSLDSHFTCNIEPNAADYLDTIPTVVVGKGKYSTMESSNSKLQTQVGGGGAGLLNQENYYVTSMESTPNKRKSTIPRRRVAQPGDRKKRAKPNNRRVGSTKGKFQTGGRKKMQKTCKKLVGGRRSNTSKTQKIKCPMCDYDF